MPIALVFAETSPPVVERRVAMIQALLRRAGHFNGSIDAKYGPGTTSSVKAYQSTKSLPVTGAVDHVTGQALDLPYWTQSLERRLAEPYRDGVKFPPDTVFDFRSLMPGGFFSSRAPEGYSRGNPLTLRALRSNNPGAVNISRWQRDLMQGYVGKTEPDNSPDRNETTIYRTPEHGVAMWGYLLRIKYFRGNPTPVSVRSIIEKYRGGIPAQPYLDGYKRWSLGALLGDTMVDLYDNRQLAVLAIAAYSHELGFWYPLTDEQMLRGFAICDEYTAIARTTLQTEATSPMARESVLSLDGAVAIGNEEVFSGGVAEP